MFCFGVFGAPSSVYNRRCYATVHAHKCTVAKVLTAVTSAQSIAICRHKLFCFVWGTRFVPKLHFIFVINCNNNFGSIVFLFYSFFYFYLFILQSAFGHFDANKNQNSQKYIGKLGDETIESNMERSPTVASVLPYFAGHLKGCEFHLHASAAML